MTNLAQTQASWNQIGREAGVFLGPIKELRDAERKYASDLNRIQVREYYNNGVAFTSTWVLAGVQVGVNTSELGELFARIADETPGAGQAQISLYKATGAGGSDLVARGSGADGSTVTLTAQNSSGLSGTVKISTVTASEANDLHKLLVYPDWQLRKRPIFDDSQPEHGALKVAFDNACAQARSSILQAVGAWTLAFTLFLESRFADFNQSSSDSSPISGTASDQAGAVTVVYKGVLEDARKNMVDEATAGAQKVVQNTITVGTPAFDGQNQGQGAMVAPTMTQWAQDGTITLICTDNTIGSERFQVTQRLTAKGTSLQAQNDLQVKQAFADPVLGISSMFLSRTLALVAGSTNDVGNASGWTINGENSGNTSNGQIFLKVIASGGGVVTSKIAIGAGAVARTFAYSYKGIAQSVVLSGGANSCNQVVSELNSDATFLTYFIASNDGSNKLVITMKLTADGEYAQITNGSFNAQGGSAQDTFNDNTIINKFRVDGYLSALYTSATQVFTSTTAQVSGAITLSQINSSGMTGSATLGSAPTHGNTATLDLKCFQNVNTNGVPDKITVKITAPNSSRGEFQDRIAELFGYGLNPAPSGSQTLNEGYVSAGTFPPYSVRDA